MLRRQVSSFLLVGGVATIAQYAVMIGLKELAHVQVIPATLIGYVIGGLVNYALNRRHTFDTDRSHAEAGWRFALVATFGFFLTWILMRFLTVNLVIPYILAQMFTTGVNMVVNFLVHRLWTFRAAAARPEAS